MRRYLPLVLLTTGFVIAVPALLVSAIVPRGSPVLLAASGLSAVAFSVAIATAASALWKRQPHSRDIIFSDLLLWGWLRRCWTERRLSQARELYDSARKSGPGVSIELLTGLSRLLEARDAYTHGHGQRVSLHAAQIARAMHLSPTQVAKIRTAATVHDVGKLYMPREILNNPGRLTDAEFDVVKRHAAWGARMLADVGDPEITAMVRHHHERIDGKGYPDELAGTDIPLGARIIAVADTFDAMTSSRAYRSACTQKKALDVLATEAGTQLDGAAVAAFRHRYSAHRSVAWLALAAALPGRILAGLQSVSPSFASAGGLASLVPGIGAAGLLALSPALHPGTAALKHHRLGGLAESSVILPVSATAAPAPTGLRTHAGSVTPISRPVHRTPGGSSATPVSTSRPAPTPRAPSSPSATHGHEAGGAGSPPPAGPGLPSISTPPVTPPPVSEVPTPTPPPSPPISVPNVPGVNLPPVQVPSVPGTGLTLPKLP
jgi:hypothetical protein